MTRRISDSVLDGATVLAALCAIVAVVLMVRGRGPTVLASPEDRELMGWDTLPERGHLVGNPEAGLTMTVFFDYECPFCATLERTLDEAIERFPEDFAVVFRHFPLSRHPNAYRTARAAECAFQQGKFWEFHRQAFELDDYSERELVRLASRVEVGNLGAFEECLSSIAPVPAIEEDLAVAHEFVFFGSPALIVGNELSYHLPTVEEIEWRIRVMKEEAG